MRILVCPDSFKGSLSSSEAAAIIKKAFCDTLGDVEAALCPLADGGPGHGIPFALEDLDDF